MAVDSPPTASPESAADARPISAHVLWLKMVARQVDTLHQLGRLHLRIERTGIATNVDGQPLLTANTSSRLWSRDHSSDASLPRELYPLVPLELPTDRSAAEQQLRLLGVSFDPRQIDVFQLGVLAGEVLAEVGPDEYLRSVRVKQRVPVACRELLERAWGVDGRSRFRDVAEFSAVLAALNQSQTDAFGGAALPAPVVSDTATVSLTPAGSAHIGTPVGSLGEPEAPPTRLGPYELSERIGAGGMGDVYRGVDRTLGRSVAIKVLPAELARQPEFVARFYAEASAAAGLMHPNVIPIHFIGEDSGRHYFVMPLVDGESLATRLTRLHRLEVAEVLPLIDDVLAGLNAAHEQGLIHRDIKPGNILLDRRTKRAIVVDFGLVKSLGETGCTATGVVLGTVDYMAPEQGRGRAVDHRCDLYAVGVLLYQLLSGRLPFAADSPTGLIFQHVYERPVALPELAPDVPAALWTVVARLMAKSPDTRYDSAQTVREDLQAIREQRPLPSQSDRRDFESFWRPVSERSGDRSLIITAPQFDEDPGEPGLARVDGWLDRVLDGWKAWWQRHRPEWVAELESTQQQVAGAVAEYQRRRDRVRGLVREAESVLAELQAQHSDHPDAAELSRLINGQAEQLDAMRVNLARVEVRLQQLRGQRDVLNARLKVAQARRHVHGTKLATAGRFFVRPSATQLAMLMLLCTIFAVTLKLRWKELTDFGEPSAADNAAARNVAGLQSQSWPAVSAFTSQLERRLAVSRDGALAVTAQFRPDSNRPGRGAALTDGVELKAWDLRSGSERTTFEEPHLSQALSLSADNTVLMSVGQHRESKAGELRLWNAKTGKLLHRIDGEFASAGKGIGFSADGAQAYALVGTSRSNSLAIVDVRNGTVEQRPLPQAADRATALAVSFDGNRAAIAVTQNQRDGRTAIDIHNFKQQRMLTSLQLSTEPDVKVTAQVLAFSPDDRLLAASASGTMHLIETTDWTEIANLRGTGLAQRLEFSPDGRYLAQLQGHKVQVWNIATRTEVPLAVAVGEKDFAFGAENTLILVSAGARFHFFDAVNGKELLGLKHRDRE